MYSAEEYSAALINRLWQVEDAHTQSIAFSFAG